MKNVICLVASLAFLANAEAQYVIKKNFGDFNGIEVSSAARVNLHQSDSNYITISSKDSLRKKPKIEVHDGVLAISSPVKGSLDVYAKNITSIKVSDAAKIVCKDTLEANNLTVKASDAGTADIWVHAKKIKARADDAGSITFSGFSDSLDVKVSDAGNVNSANLRAGNVKAVSSDGSNISVRADSSIAANSSDGSNIKIVGKPKQKTISASDGSAVVNSDSCKNKGFNMSINGDFLIGGGFVTGGANGNGADVKYGASREFIVGLGKSYKIVKWNALGWDIYYKSTDFYLDQDANKTFPESALYQSEKISTQNFGGLIYDRFYINKNIFIDGGFYYDWAFHSKHIIWNTNPTDGSTDKIKAVNLNYVNTTDYGLTVRMGVGADVAFYFNYRLTPLLQNTLNSGQSCPTLPPCTLGIIFIM